MSVNSTDPGTIFGGTWVQLKDQFLLGAGSSYTAGDTGGSKTHTHSSGATGSTTLTSSHIPQHAHSVRAHSHGLNSHTHGVGTLKTASAGGHGHGISTANGLGKREWGFSFNYDGKSELNTGAMNTNDAAHTHTISGATAAASGSTANSTAFNTGNWGTASPSGHTHTIPNTNSASSLPPYLVVYMWKRTQ